MSSIDIGGKRVRIRGIYIDIDIYISIFVHQGGHFSSPSRPVYPNNHSGQEGHSNTTNPKPHRADQSSDGAGWVTQQLGIGYFICTPYLVYIRIIRRHINVRLNWCIYTCKCTMKPEALHIYASEHFQSSPSEQLSVKLMGTS